MSIQHIPLDRLTPSPRNVRKTGGASIDALAASIHAHGLLQNLTVSPAGDDNFMVEAGNRRLRALMQLVADGDLAPDWPVPCHVLPAADKRSLAEASLAENVMRHAMHPADEFDAFAELVQDGLTIGEISARFGQSELFVKQRLKLANVAPDILADYRAGKATLEQMMALALTDDQAMQARIWKAARNDWQREPDRLRSQITAAEAGTDSRLGKFVGLDAYEKAGGSIRRDLFGTESYMQDTELLATLAQAKLERTAEKITSKEGWLWVETRMDFDYSDERAFGRIYPAYKGSKETWSDEAKATAGVIVTIGHNGNTEIKRGLVRAQDRKAASAASGEPVTGGKAKAEHKPGDLSFAAVQRLQAEASDIIALDVAEKPQIAMALLAAELADKAFYDGWDGPRIFVHIRREASGRMPGNIAQISGRAPAARRMNDQLQEWKARLPKKRDEARAWILQQDTATVEKLLAFLIAREIDAVEFGGGPKKGTVVDLAAETRTDLSQSWSPTDDWLATLPKAVVLALAKDAGASDIVLAQLAKCPKAALPAEALPHFPAGWLPPALRPRSVPKKAAPSKKPASSITTAKKSATKKPVARKAKKAPAKKVAKARAK